MPTSPPRNIGITSNASLALRAGRRFLTLLHFFLASAAFAAFIPDASVRREEPGPAAQRARLLEAMGVPAWHAAGWRGQGVRAAVLDTGFRGYRAYLGRALPERVTVRSFCADGDLEAKDSQHGILCGEVLHAVAPEAELLFANWDSERPDEFLEAVRWARRQGARVITCSVIMPTWSDGEGGGAVHRALADVLGNGDKPEDVLFFAGAGNTALRQWGGPFRDGGDGLHEWAPGRIDNLIRPWEGETPSVEMCWAAGPTYELSVMDLTAGREAGRCEPVERTGHGCAAVRFEPEAGHSYAARVRLTRGAPAAFHLTVLGGGLEETIPGSGALFPADGAEVIAVGAVDADGRRLEYSAWGHSGALLKPDLAAVVPFPSLWRPRPFTGTSAAAPQAASVAAIAWSSHSEWSAARVREALWSAARRGDPVGAVDEIRRGTVRLP